MKYTYGLHILFMITLQALEVTMEATPKDVIKYTYSW